MKRGDLVGEINNSWMKHNPWAYKASKDFREGLFKYSGPDPLGVVIEVSINCKFADVLLADGEVKRFDITDLEVIKRC